MVLPVFGIPPSLMKGRIMNQVFTGGQPMHIVGRKGAIPLPAARFDTIPSDLPTNCSHDEYREHRRRSSEYMKTHNDALRNERAS